MRPCATTGASELREDELESLLDTVKKHSLKGKYLEVGTAAGGTLWRLMKCFTPSERPPFVVVDPMKYFPGQFDAVRNNLTKHGVDPSDVDFRVQTSLTALDGAEAKGEVFEFMLIDGCHKIRRILEDLRWTERLCVGGVVAFHDYSPEQRGVKIVLDRFVKKNPNFKVLKYTHTLLILKKVEKSLRPAVGAWDRALALLCSPLLQWEYSFKKRQRRRAARKG